jgi:hypothetical protein
MIGNRCNWPRGILIILEKREIEHKYYSLIFQESGKTIKTL